MFMKTFHVARRSPSHPETIRYHVDLEIASMSGTGKTVPLATLEAETIEEATAAVHERYGSAFFPIEVNETTIPLPVTAPDSFNPENIGDEPDMGTWPGMGYPENN
jgi:hypothetical protein